MNDHTDWYCLKRGAMYYGMTLAKSAASDPALQEVFYTAFYVAEYFRNLILEQMGYQWSYEKQVMWYQDNSYYSHGASPVHNSTDAYTQVWDYNHYDTVYNYHDQDDVHTAYPWTPMDYVYAIVSPIQNAVHSAGHATYPSHTYFPNF